MRVNIFRLIPVVVVVEALVGEVDDVAASASIASPEPPGTTIKSQLL